MAVVVFGSINIDLVARSPHLPIPGETLTGSNFATISGGKGANQAVAAARLGVPTQIVGRVGQDTFGTALLNELAASGVNCDRILIDATTHSGVAVITVDHASENTIVIIPGANGQVDETDVARLRQSLTDAKVLLLQLEIPLPAVIAAAKVAKQAGITVILDPAPARSDLPQELYASIDILTPNQVEASQLVGFEVKNFEAATMAAQLLRERGVNIVIIKLGKQGALCCTQNETFTIPAFPVKAVDTVAAGDAFNGGLAAGLATGMTLPQATHQAAAVAALSVTQAGAQPSLPTRSQLDLFWTEGAKDC